jgi:hypothetical protein
MTTKQITALIGFAFALFGAYKAFQRVRKEFAREPAPDQA